ncbi:BA75_00716T0 [Komagataella pastoris]|uniref:BA75_00716T0 n=1 Tax=Komagataella pastoris TaxID=4922 RepID=A0A1B2J680_PICPA|nr:BA75_00716T0 [Komagataella pastoris]
MFHQFEKGILKYQKESTFHRLLQPQLGKMDPNNLKVQVEVDPTEDTEWNDILRSHGIIPEKEPDPTEELEKALSEAVEKQHANRLEHKDLDELAALEDEEDEEFLEEYKKKRMAEIQKLNDKSLFGSVYPISKPEYQKEVTETSKTAFVFLHMTLQSALQSRLLSALMVTLSSKFKEIKFCEIPANRAVENYPDGNCPTILIYHNGDVVKQFITLTQLGGNDTKIEDLERILVSIGAVDEHDRRLVINNEDEESSENRKIRFQGKSIKSKAYDSEEDDDFYD